MVNIMSTVPHFFLNPHCLSDMTLSRKYLVILFRMQARSLPAVLRSEMPLVVADGFFTFVLKQMNVVGIRVCVCERERERGGVCLSSTSLLTHRSTLYGVKLC